MKYNILVVFLFFTFGLYAQVDTLAVKDRGLKIVGLFKENKYQDIEAMLSPTMKPSVNSEKLKQVWEAVGQKLGSLKSYQKDCLITQGNSSTVFIKCDFENSPIIIKLIFDGEYMLQGFYFVNNSDCI